MNRLIEGRDYIKKGNMRTMLKPYFSAIRVPVFQDYDLPVTQEHKFGMRQGQVLVDTGFTWDGASGPTWDSGRAAKLHWYLGDPSSVVDAPFYHDLLYMSTRRILGPYTPAKKQDYKRLQKAADDFFKDELRRDGATWLRRNAWHKAVRWFGWRHIIGEAK